MDLREERKAAGERSESRHASAAKRSAASIGAEQRLWESLAADAFRDSPAPIPQADRESILTEKKRNWSKILCSNARDPTSLRMAERLVREWFDCTCDDVKLDNWRK